MKLKPYIINFPIIGDQNIGFISLAEKQNLPFKIKRVYWTYNTPDEIERGGHAHIELEQILVAVCGKIDLTIQTIDGEFYNFILDHPGMGVFIPKKSWRTMKYNFNAVQMCLASMEYSENDYVRDYDEFLKIIL